MADPTNATNPQPTEGLVIDPNASQRDQILGVSAQTADPQRERIDPKWHRFYDQLVRQRDELIDATTDIQGKTREVSPDPIQDSPAEIGTPEHQRDQLLGVLTLDSELLQEINEAVSRMEAGSYGICQATGKPIPEERLEAIPWARFTVEAEADLESRNGGMKAGIGARGSFAERGTAPPGPPRDHEGSI